MLTITEALAEMKTLQKRIEKKRESIGPYLLRQAVVLDPLEQQGGSKEFIRKERQALKDLENRMVTIRTSIQQVNQVTTIQIESETRTIAEWLTWRKEVSHGQSLFLKRLHTSITGMRTEIQKRGGTIGESVDASALNVIVNVDEALLLKEIEEIENILGKLDGQLSLKNATVLIEV
jgi:hypothetical protein